MTMQPSSLTMLVRAALLGTDHATTAARSAEEADVADMISRISQDDAPGALLSEAALLTLRDLAGGIPDTARGELAASASDEDPHHSLVRDALAGQLNAMLAGANVEVLPEWLDQVSARGWRVPFTSLPALLEHGQQHAAVRAQIARVLGARGRWLATHNAEWAYAIERPLDAAALRSAWELGSAPERKALLQHVRAHDAALGRTLVESTLAEESPAARAMLIAGLRINLEAADEPLLELALDDRRQEVREEASSLLTRLPASALGVRMAARASALISYQPRKGLRCAQLTVNLPTESDAAMARDGIALKPPVSKAFGERAWWLIQVIGAVPPRTWSETWRVKPAALVALARESEWSAAMLSGWSLAAITHRDAEWADGLLRAGAEAAVSAGPVPGPLQLLGVLDPVRREAFVSEALRAAPASLPTLELLAGMDHDWSMPFARTVLRWLTTRIAAAASEGSWRLAQILPALALHMPHMLAADADKACRTDAELSSGLPRAIDRFTTVLMFRHALYQELDK